MTKTALIFLIIIIVGIFEEIAWFVNRRNKKQSNDNYKNEDGR